MNKRYKEDIESFLNYVDGKEINPTPHALTVYRRYEKKLDDIEIWPEIFDKILGEKFIDEDADGYFVISHLGWWSKEKVGSYEEIYRDIMGWESDTLDFRDVWNKFYKRYIEMKEALEKYGCADNYE